MTFDIAVIGAGIVGSALARDLAGTGRSVALIEARADVGDGTSKANTAILHTGFDAIPGTLEARLVPRGYHLLGEYAARTGIPIERTGALLVAWDDEELGKLPELQAKAEANGYDECRLVDAAQVYERVPDLGVGALGGLTVPGESIICTWTTNLALATDAVRRGAVLRRGARVLGVRRGEGSTRLVTTSGDVTARWVINAAGLGADHLDRSFGHDRFTVTPRRGELLVFDKLARSKVPCIVLPGPSSRGKGVLVSPTIYGNVMLGPTSENLTDRTATGTSQNGFDFLIGKGRRLMPSLLDEEVTAAYAGLRAAIGRDDYLIDVDAERRYVLVGGIRSTGLTGGMAIAEHVVALLQGSGIDLSLRSELPDPPRMPMIGEAGPRPYQDEARIRDDSAYGALVCFCERVSSGEIRDAFASPIPPVDLDGLRRRTRVMNGRCQGFYCGAHVRDLLNAKGSESSVERGRPAVKAAARRSRAAPLEEAAVVIVGGGPAGLTAATELASQVDGPVLVIEREMATGGIPRHSDHLGYGLGDLRRFISGPAYARRLTSMAQDAGAVLETQAMVTGWVGDRRLEVTAPSGRRAVAAGAVVLATGARERPRAARLIPGDRPEGVFTTGELQNLVHLSRAEVGSRAVVVGAELVSWSAVLTLRAAHCATVAMTTESARGEAYAAFRVAGRRLLRGPLLTRARVVAIEGRERVRAVVLTNLDTGQCLRIECDTVITTGDWVAENELGHRAGIAADEATGGPLVGGGLGTSRFGVFAAGNLLHPVDTAYGAALDGRQVAATVATWLRSPAPARSGARIRVEPPLRWVVPQLVVRDDAPPRLSLWVDEYRRFPKLRATQRGRLLREVRLPRPAAPGRVFRAPWSLVAAADPDGEDITLELR